LLHPGNPPNPETQFPRHKFTGKWRAPPEILKTSGGARQRRTAIPRTHTLGSTLENPVISVFLHLVDSDGFSNLGSDVSESQMSNLGSDASDVRSRQIRCLFSDVVDPSVFLFLSPFSSPSLSLGYPLSVFSKNSIPTHRGFHYLLLLYSQIQVKGILIRMLTTCWQCATRSRWHHRTPLLVGHFPQVSHSG